MNTRTLYIDVDVDSTDDYDYKGFDEKGRVALLGYISVNDSKRCFGKEIRYISCCPEALSKGLCELLGREYDDITVKEVEQIHEGCLAGARKRG